MLTRKSFIKQVKDLGYTVVEEENEIKINKKNVTYAVAGDVEQYSITFKNTPANLKSLVREYEDTRIDKRSGYYVIPLKLVDDVEKLHKEVFDEKDYKAPETIKEIYTEIKTKAKIK